MRFSAYPLCTFALLLFLPSLLSASSIEKNAGPSVKSDIPSFARYSHHSWARENLDALELLADPHAFLCNPHGSSEPASASIEPPPDDLFAEINLYSFLIDGILNNLIELCSCPVALSRCRVLSISADMWDHDMTLSGLLTDLLTLILTEMGGHENGNLTHLYLWADDDHLARAGQQNPHLLSLQVRSVRNLTLSRPLCRTFLGAFPNVKVVEIEDNYATLYKDDRGNDWDRYAANHNWEDLLSPLLSPNGNPSSPSDIVDLSLHTVWRPEVVEAVRQTAPRLKTLRVGGWVTYPADVDLDEPDDPNGWFRGVLGALARFDELEELRLPIATLLDVGLGPPRYTLEAWACLDELTSEAEFSPGSCEPQGPHEKWWPEKRWERLRYVAAAERAGQWALDALKPGLDRIYIGSERVDVGDDGRTPQWRWTGRLADHLMECGWGRHPGEDPLGPILLDREQDWRYLFKNPPDIVMPTCKAH